MARDTACGQASNATLLLMRRGGVSGAQSACEFQAIEQSGPRSYRVTQNCGGLPDEPAEPVHYNIPDDTTFGYGAEGNEKSYRHCEQSKLPDPWRDNDISDLLE